jgi:signal transduction histidine kinase/ligand-binding sensor domain-containing protein
MDVPTPLRSFGRWCLLGLLCLTAFALQPGAAQQTAPNAKPATSGPTPGPNSSPTPSPTPSPASNPATPPAAAASAIAAPASAEFSFTDPLFEPVGDSESIPYGVVTALAFDAQGIQWIGTQSGLVRYDGYRFRKFVHDASQSDSLPGNFVERLWVGADGRLWIGITGTGLAVYDPATERFRSVSHAPQLVDDSKPRAVVIALGGTAAGDLWVGTDQGLDFLPHGSSQFRHYRHDPADAASLADDGVNALLVDHQGVLWVGGSYGLQRLLPDGQSFERIASAVEDADSLAERTITTLFEAADGKLWIGTDTKGAAWLDPATRQLHWLGVDPARSDRLNDPAINAITQPELGQIWLGTSSGGVNVVAADDGRVLRRLRHDASVASSLALDFVSALAPDRAGLLAVGTWGGGLQRYNPRNPALRLLRHSPTRGSGLSHADVHSVLELPNGQRLVGTGGNGIDLLDRQRGVVGGYRPQPGRPGALAFGTIDSLAQTPDGALWVAGGPTGVQRLAAGAKNWQSFGLAQGLPSIVVTLLWADHQGTLWVGTPTGLARWNGQQQRFEALNTTDGVAITRATRMVEDTLGRFWVAGRDGLWLLEPGSTNPKAIRHQPQRPASLSSDFVHGMLLDHSGRLWVDTDQGLDRLQSWDGTEAQFDHISTLVGRPGLYFGGNLLEDKLGRIWTQWYVLEPQSMRLHTLSKADGMDIGTAWAGSYAKTRDGLFLFGGTQGLAIVEPEKFQPWDFAPPLVATALQVNGQPLPLGAITPALTLSPEQRNFALEFAALDFSAPQKNRYRYRLQGYDKDWIGTSADNRVAAYGNLWPGDYTLHVQGSNRTGEWSPHELTVPVRVLPAYWQTKWFAVLVLLLLASAVYGGVRWRVARLRAEAVVLRRKVDERTADIVKLGEIGKQLTATLDTEQAFAKVYAQVCARLDAHVFRIGIFDEAKASIHFLFDMEADQRLPNSDMRMEEADRPAVWCVRERRELVTGQRSDLTLFVGTVLPPRQGAAMETVVYLPLLVGERVIGCISAQSPQAQAYSHEQLEFLRVLASYTAIALSNGIAHGDLAKSLDDLQAAQAQLIQAEKMASLGQLVANVAHEINTPMGAVKSSGESMASSLRDVLLEMPRLGLVLSEAEQALFVQLVGCAQAGSAPLTTRELRAARRDLGGKLAAAGLQDADDKATLLVDLHAQGAWEAYVPLLTHLEYGAIATAARTMALMVNSTSNIHLAVERVSKIVGALKGLAQGGEAGTVQAVDAAQVLDGVLTTYQNQIKQGITLVRNTEALPPIACVPEDMKQLWTQLIHNALQAMETAGTLTLGLRAEAGCAVLTVADTGCGIPTAIRNKIFDAFFTTRRTGEGSGLGLYLAQQIVNKWGGSIAIESAEGVGTTVTVRVALTGG